MLSRGMVRLRTRSCDIPIPTVKAAADVAACPTKGKAGSITVASCLPNCLRNSTHMQLCVRCIPLPLRHIPETIAPLAHQICAPDVTLHAAFDNVTSPSPLVERSPDRRDGDSTLFRDTLTPDKHYPALVRPIMRYLYQNIEQDPARCHSCGLCRRHVWVVYCLSSARRYVRRMHQLLVKSVTVEHNVVSHTSWSCVVPSAFTPTPSLTPICIAFMTLSRAPEATTS